MTEYVSRTVSLCVKAHDCEWKDLLWDSGDNMRGSGLNKVWGAGGSCPIHKPAEK
jgi:hypothetical protein